MPREHFPGSSNILCGKGNTRSHFRPSRSPARCTRLPHSALLLALQTEIGFPTYEHLQGPRYKLSNAL